MGMVSVRRRARRSGSEQGLLRSGRVTEPVREVRDAVGAKEDMRGREGASLWPCPAAAPVMAVVAVEAVEAEEGGTAAGETGAIMSEDTPSP